LNHLTGEGTGWRNYMSYRLVDEFIWLGLKDQFNDFRQNVIGLPPIGNWGAHVLNDKMVPFVKMWSPSLVPKPEDWGENVDVVGNFFLHTASEYTPPRDLEAFLAEGSAPIFVGFGSMMIEDTAGLTKLIISAAEQTSARVVIQSSWSELRPEGGLPEGIFCLGPAPHDWLLPRMAAVVHHGGAGTVAAGLQCGRPTFVCPFFGDQHFWGEFVSRAGIGPPPCPVAELTVERLVSSFEVLLHEETRKRALLMAEAWKSEDGVQGGVDAFHKHLPIEDMVCDVSLFLEGRPCVATKYLTEVGLKVSTKIFTIALSHGLVSKSEEYSPVRWNVASIQAELEAFESKLLRTRDVKQSTNDLGGLSKAESSTTLIGGVVGALGGGTNEPPASPVKTARARSGSVRHTRLRAGNTGRNVVAAGVTPAGPSRRGAAEGLATADAQSDSQLRCVCRTLTQLVDDSKSGLGGLLGKGSVNVADLEPLVAQLDALVEREEEERAVVAAFLKASKARQLFDEMDTEGSGFMDLPELERMLRHHLAVEDKMNLLGVVKPSWHHLAVEDANVLLEEISKTGEGATQVSFAEFCQWFARLGSNEREKKAGRASPARERRVSVDSPVELEMEEPASANGEWFVDDEEEEEEQQPGPG